jgi:hypothetical protein
MTVDAFRKHKFLPAQWRKELATNGILQAVIQVLEEAHPTRFSVHTDIQDDLSPTKAALQLGETRGYSKVLNTMRILAQPMQEISGPVEPTYSKPPKPAVDQYSAP